MSEEREGLRRLTRFAEVQAVTARSLGRAEVERAWLDVLVLIGQAEDENARLIAAAEQRGREDNADHGMCYVSGSRALESLIAAAEARALREAAIALGHIHQADSAGATACIKFLRDRAAALGTEREAEA